MTCGRVVLPVSILMLDQVMVVVPCVNHVVRGSVIKQEVSMDLELELHRKAVKEASYPHITRRLIQDHLGQQWYVTVLK